MTPIGLILPERLGAGGAWGEWSAETLKGLVGYVPRGLDRLSRLWSAPVPQYGADGPSGVGRPVNYMVSGLLGAALVVAASYLVSRMLVKRQSFLDKGMHHLASVIKTSYLQWETACKDGLMQRLDARVKVLFLAVFIVVVSLKKEIAPQLLILALTFSLAVASRVDLAGYLRRIFFLSFFFGFLVALPSALNVVNKGTVVLPLFSLGRAHDFYVYHVPKDVGVTREGLRGVLMLTMRVMNSVSLSMLLLYTTPFTEAVRALKALRAPDVFLMVVALSYKYIFVFARTVEDMHLAKKSRQMGAVEGADARRWVAGRMAFIFKKTQLECEEIFKAMLSRGFTGEVRLYGAGRLRVKDWAAGGIAVVAGTFFMLL